jgi:hypothetical protein
MLQRVPTYTEEDLSRVIVRDYGTGAEQVTAILSDYSKESHHRDPLRVWMACLKLANGNMERLNHYVKNACVDYRDVLAWAEYPEYLNARTPDEQSRAIENDWKQLQEWLLK